MIISRRLAWGASTLAAGVLAIAAVGVGQQAARRPGFKDTPMLPGGRWHVHDSDRPWPAVVTPGTASTQDQPGKAPSDAVVLFDGKDLSKWRSEKGADAGWDVKDGAVVKGHKVGLTSAAMQRQMGVDTPDFGVLLDSMFVAEGVTCDITRFLQPRAEPEIAFSTAGMSTRSRSLVPRSISICASASMQAAPPISFFMLSMPLSGLISSPPVSKHTPLPTSVILGWVGSPQEMSIRRGARAAARPTA